MIFFRVVLAPPQETWPAYFALTADAKVVAEGYCMSSGTSVPHVTLCKFGVEDAAQVEKIWQAIEKLQPPKVVFESLDIKGEGDEPRCAMLMNKKNEIMDFQKQVVAIVREHGGMAEADGDYDPHLTLVVSALQDKALLASRLGSAAPFLNKSFAFKLAIGTTIPGGQVPELVKEAAVSPRPVPAPIAAPKSP